MASDAGSSATARPHEATGRDCPLLYHDVVGGDVARDGLEVADLRPKTEVASTVR